MSITALSWKLKRQKNIQSISRLLWERSHPELRNELPLDSLDPQSLNPFMASLWIGSGEGLAIKGFEDWGSRLSSGGSFWSPGWGRSRSSLEIDWIFFCHFNFTESARFRVRVFKKWPSIRDIHPQSGLINCSPLCWTVRFGLTIPLVLNGEWSKACLWMPIFFFQNSSLSYSSKMAGFFLKKNAHEFNALS